MHFYFPGAHNEDSSSSTEGNAQLILLSGILGDSIQKVAARGLLGTRGKKNIWVKNEQKHSGFQKREWKAGRGRRIGKVRPRRVMDARWWVWTVLWALRNPGWVIRMGVLESCLCFRIHWLQQESPTVGWRVHLRGYHRISTRADKRARMRMPLWLTG